VIRSGTQELLHNLREALIEARRDIMDIIYENKGNWTPAAIAELVHGRVRANDLRDRIYSLNG
jgi:hypothetical protein